MPINLLEEKLKAAEFEVALERAEMTLNPCICCLKLMEADLTEGKTQLTMCRFLQPKHRHLQDDHRSYYIVNGLVKRELADDAMLRCNRCMKHEQDCFQVRDRSLILPYPY